MFRTSLTRHLVLTLCIALAACSPRKQEAVATAPIGAANVDAARIINADSEPGSWMSHGRTYSEQRFSPLDSISKTNVGTLGLGWFADIDTDRGQEATPIVVDGVLYVSTAWSRVKAFDARTGQALWSFDPQVPGEWGVNACCDVVNRGVAVWKGKVFVGTLDGRLVALDSKTGSKLWDVMTIDQSKPYTITGAPRVIKGKVLIGNGGAEFGVRGYISAYDADTGKMAWRFYTVPGNPADGFESPALETAAKTWSGQWWRIGGGGTVWDSMSYDPGLDLLYIGVGNGSPWNHTLRSEGKGDNLFLSSIVALKPDTGEYVWHYQSTPGDSWDYTAVQQIMTADLTINGEKRHVVMQAPKNGFFYVLDAASGKLISAEKYAAVNWAERVDLATGRPVDNPRARYPNGKAARLSVGPNGGHVWHPMAFNPSEGLVYIPAQRGPFTYKNDANWKFVRGRWNLAQNGAFSPSGPPPPIEPMSAEAEAVVAKLPPEGGTLVAWDPVKQQARWTVRQETGWNGGVLATAGGLVFGGADRTFNAYDSRTGEKLWTQPTAAVVMAGPATYEIDGEQYIAVSVGYGGSNAVIGGRYPRRPGRLHVYKLGGTAKAPEYAPFAQNPPLDMTQVTASSGNATHGGQLVEQWCLSCHIGGIYIPDLARSPRLTTPGLFRQVVLDGELRPRGMASFAQWLNEGDAEDIRAYLLEQAAKVK